MKHWKIGLCASPSSCWARLTSKLAVPVPHPYLNLCRASCKTKPRFNRQFATAEHTFHATSTIPIPQYSPFPFGMSTIFAHASSAGGALSPKFRCTNLTSISHRLLASSFLRIAFCRQPFNYYARIPTVPPLYLPSVPLLPPQPPPLLVFHTLYQIDAPWGGPLVPPTAYTCRAPPSPLTPYLVPP